MSQLTAHIKPLWKAQDVAKRCVVLRDRPDRVTWIKRSELMVKPSVEDKEAVVQ